MVGQSQLTCIHGLHIDLSTNTFVGLIQRACINMTESNQGMFGRAPPSSGSVLQQLRSRSCMSQKYCFLPAPNSSRESKRKGASINSVLNTVQELEETEPLRALANEALIQPNQRFIKPCSCSTHKSGINAWIYLVLPSLHNILLLLAGQGCIWLLQLH